MPKTKNLSLLITHACGPDKRISCKRLLIILLILSSNAQIVESPQEKQIKGISEDKEICDHFCAHPCQPTNLIFPTEERNATLGWTCVHLKPKIVPQSWSSFFSKNAWTIGGIIFTIAGISFCVIRAYLWSIEPNSIEINV